MITFRRILFPVDFSARCAAAVPSVKAMVKRFGSEVTVLHVVDLPHGRHCSSGGGRVVGADRRRAAAGKWQVALASFLEREFSGSRFRAKRRRATLPYHHRLCAGRKAGSDHDADQRDSVRSGGCCLVR